MVEKETEGRHLETQERSKAREMHNDEASGEKMGKHVVKVQNSKNL